MLRIAAASRSSLDALPLNGATSTPAVIELNERWAG